QDDHLVRDLGSSAGRAAQRFLLSVHPQHAPSQQRQRHLLGHRPDGRRRPDRLELEPAPRRSRSGRLQGHLRHQRPGEGRHVPGLHRVSGEPGDHGPGHARTLTQNRFLQVRLDGSGANRFAVGAKVTLWSGGRQFYQEEEPTRGFQSSVDYVLTFGVGPRDTLDSVKVEWPDREGRVSLLTRVAANQRLTIRESESRTPSPEPRAPRAPILRDVTNAVALPYIHHENDFVDFDREPLIQNLLSTEG